MSKLYQIKDLKFGYGTKTVLQINELSLEKGKTYTFLGENGSGKTTFLKILNGLITAEGVLFEGSSDKKNIRKKTIYVHQNPLLFGGTVFYNIAYGLKLRKEKDISKKVRKALEIVGLEGFEKRKSTELSGGEMQRVALARALVLNPKVLLLDEPTANIDKQTVLRFSEILKEIKRNTTVIISTHDHAFAYHNCDEMMHLENGMIQMISENIFKGEITEKSENSLLFKVDDIKLKCPASEGNFNTAVIDFKDIILSDKEILTSARNKLEGKVMKIKQKNGLFIVNTDAGIKISSLIWSC